MKKVLVKIKDWFVKVGKAIKSGFIKLVQKIKCIKWKRVFEKSRNLSLMLAGIFMMVSCVVYVFATDLFANNNSVWLLCGALLGFGAGILGMLSEIKKENEILTYCLKGVALGLMIGFVIFLTFFEKSTVVTSLDETDKYFSLFLKSILNKPDDYVGFECLKAIKASMVITYILAYTGIAIQAFNITSNAILGIEE